MDARAMELVEFVSTRIGRLLTREESNFGVPPRVCLQRDVDTFATDNCQTVKESVGRTATEVNGYCPLAA